MIKIFKKTHDDWCGNFNGDEVALKYHGNIVFSGKDADIKPLFRVSVWGNDDLGMIRDIRDEMEAKGLFDMLSKRAFIDMEDLDELGFVMF